jgi:renalase
MVDADVIVIGSGMSGLSCARRLVGAGLKVIVIDKGRGIGGRMATRRAGTPTGKVRFDHGAQYFTAREPGFAGLLHNLSGTISPWNPGPEKAHLVGVPGMSDLPRAMAAGLNIRQGMEVTDILQGCDSWIVTAGQAPLTAGHVVVTVPAPQLAPLIGADHPLLQQMVHVVMDPCLTLMAAIRSGSPQPFISRRSESAPLAWIACDSSKPGRSGAAVTWVAQASPSWSRQYLETDKDALVPLMLPLLCEAIGTRPEQAVFTAAHRWRYARVAVPLGKTFLRSDCGGLYAGGDWCIGARVEAAWQSGDAIAQDILERRDVG